MISLSALFKVLVGQSKFNTNCSFSLTTLCRSPAQQKLLLVSAVLSSARLDNVNGTYVSIDYAHNGTNASMKREFSFTLENDRFIAVFNCKNPILHINVSFLYSKADFLFHHVSENISNITIFQF